MLDRLALRILERAKAALDDSVPAERIRAFLAEALTAAEAELSSRKVSLPPEAEGELRRARSLAARLGLLAAEPGPPSADPAAEPPALQEAEAWLRELRDGKAISRAGLAPGAGAALLALLERPSNEHAEFLDSSLESLLRHVETRRRAGLRLDPAPPGVDAWMEWLSVAILLARAARRRGDLRMLNATLKLNDWAFPVHRRMRAGPRLARYLLSLAEQETAISEEIR